MLTDEYAYCIDDFYVIIIEINFYYFQNKD